MTSIEIITAIALTCSFGDAVFMKNKDGVFNGQVKSDVNVCRQKIWKCVSDVRTKNDKLTTKLRNECNKAAPSASGGAFCWKNHKSEEPTDRELERCFK